MKEFHRLPFLIAFFLFFTCIMPYISAFSVSSVIINPPGYQAAGTPVTLNTVIDFSQGENETFSSSSELQLSTDLVDTHWVPLLVLDGVETHLSQKNGELMTLPGWYLSYPSTQNVQVKVKLTGNFPANPSPGLNFLKIQETDFSYRVVSTAHVEMPAKPVTTFSVQIKTPAIKKYSPRYLPTLPLRNLRAGSAQEFSP